MPPVARRAELRVVPAYEEGSDRAGMFVHADYYANPDRGPDPSLAHYSMELTRSDGWRVSAIAFDLDRMWSARAR